MTEQYTDEYKELYLAVRQMRRYDGVDKQKYIEAQRKVYDIAYAIQLNLEREEDDDDE